MRSDDLNADTEEVAQLAIAAASAVVLDAEELMASLRALQAFRHVTDTETPGTAPPIPTTQNSPSRSTSPAPQRSPNFSFCTPAICSPEPAVHANIMRKLRQKEKRAHDSVAKLRRSQRLAAKEEGNFLDMLSKAVKAKAKRFDLKDASESLSAALHATGLVDDPDTPARDMNKMRDVAILWGATDEEALTITNAPVPAPAP
jgi:hypothetical protein